MRLSRIFGCVALAAAGCGGGDPPDTLTCEWLASFDNCWADAASLATICLPPEADRGTISADNTTCAYASGHVVTFDPPLVFPTTNDAIWNFTTTGRTGAPCMSYEDLEQDGTTLDVMGRTVRIAGTSSGGMSITCPDGTSVQTSNALMLLTCPTSMVPVPGLAKAWSMTAAGDSASVSASILTGLPVLVPVFSCDKSF
jgi:hypothetical protein